MRRKEIRVIRAGKEVIGEGEKKKEEIKKNRREVWGERRTNRGKGKGG